MGRCNPMAPMDIHSSETLTSLRRPVPIRPPPPTCIRRMANMNERPVMGGTRATLNGKLWVGSIVCRDLPGLNSDAASTSHLNLATRDTPAQRVRASSKSVARVCRSSCPIAAFINWLPERESARSKRLSEIRFRTYLEWSLGAAEFQELHIFTVIRWPFQGRGQT